MSFSDILTPRNEVLKSDGIQGIIDIENLNSKNRNSIESRPEVFFDLTYPTTDLKIVLDNLNQRFNSPGQSAGLFLLEGFKGSGKSHIELFIYHLFKNNDIAGKWLTKNKIECKVPDNAIVIIHKFTDFPLGSMWNLIFENVGATKFVSNQRPDLEQLRKAIGERRIVLILDELEMGYKSIENKNIQAQNLAFLQMLSEEAQRSESAAITIIASIYNSEDEPGATLKRVPKVDIKFAEPKDRRQVILHRLFQNYSDYDKNKIESVVYSYINHWRKCGIKIDEKYIDRMYESYPFTPEVFDVFLNKILRKNFQGNRGPLGILSRIVKNTHTKADIITTSHFTLKDNVIRNLLVDLDPGQTYTQCAQNDRRDLEHILLADEIVASTLVGTISATGNLRGIQDQELARQVIKPGDNYNDYMATLAAFEKLGAYFQRAEDSYFFDVHEKPYAKVEYRSLRIDTKIALEKSLERLRKNVFNDTSAFIYRDEASFKADLSSSNKNTIRYVISPKQLIDADRKKIFSGIENPNTIILIEPKTDKFNALDNNDIIKWAQLSIAAAELKNMTGDYERKKQYEKIETDNAKYIDDSFRKAGFSYILVLKDADGLCFEVEPLSNVITRTDVTEQLKKNIFPLLRIQEHLLEHIEAANRNTNWVMNQFVSDIRKSYDKTLGFPVILSESFFIDAIKNFCIEKIIGLKHTSGEFCGSYPGYSSSDWPDVKVVPPFPVEDTEESIYLAAQQPAENYPAQGSPVIPLSGDSGERSKNPVNKAVYIYTTNSRSIIELRQEIAQKLNANTSAIFQRVVFTVFLEKQNADLSSLPASLRGQMTGISNLHFELTITREGNFTKAALEQMTEQLPVFQDAQYKAELKGYSESEQAE